MLLTQRNHSATLLKTYLPPFKGTWKTVPPFLLPDDTVQDSLNVTILGGKLRSRCGLERFTNQRLQQPVIGSFLTITTENQKFPIISTRDTVYIYDTYWHTITGSVVLNATDTSQVRMTSIQIGTSVYVLYANGVDQLKVIPQSTMELQDIIPHAGSIPVLKDICTSFSRIVGFTPPYTVSWCDNINDNYLSFTNWPSLNQAILSDTEDSIVAIKVLGTLGLAVYKEGNIFVGFAQSGVTSQAFRFEHRGEYEGPAGVNSIVNVNGSHIYMTPTGRVGLFDGTSQIWLADGLWPYLQTDIDSQYASRIFGVYSYRTAEVTFWYPRVGDAGECKGMIVIPLPYPTAGIDSFSYFLGRCNISCTNGLSVRYFNGTTHPFIFDNDGKIYQLDKNSYGDNGFSFPCSFDTGLIRPVREQNDPNPHEDIYYPTFELYATRGNELAGVVEVSALTSNMLENDGNVSVAEIVDLKYVPINEFISFNEVNGSMLGARLAWDSTAQFEFKALDIYGEKVL